MAKKKAKSSASANGSRSANVRRHLEEKPDAPAADIVQAMEKQGMPISATLVYNIKREMGLSKPRKRGRRRKAAAAAAPGGGTKARAGDNVSLSALLKAKRMAEGMGGIERAKNALDALSKLS
jgi:hypothetical protein